MNYLLLFFRSASMVVLALTCAYWNPAAYGSFRFSVDDDVSGGVRLTYPTHVDLSSHASIDVAFEDLSLNGGFLVVEAQYLIRSSFDGQVHSLSASEQTTVSDGPQLVSIPISSPSADLLAINFGSSSIDPAQQATHLSGSVSEIRLSPTAGGSSRLVDDFSGPRVSESRIEVDPVGPQGTLGFRTGEADLRQVGIDPAHVLRGERRSLAFVRETDIPGVGAVSYEIDGDGTGSIIPIPEPIRSLSQIEIIHSFPESDGHSVAATVIEDSTVYGVTFDRVFSGNLDGSNFQTTKFLGATPARDYGDPLALADDTIFGVTHASEIFSVRTDGTNYQVIASREDLGLGFRNPIAIGSRIYGQTERGMFNMNLDGTDIQFTKGEIESPASAQLTFDGERIYGATWPDFTPDRLQPPLVEDGAKIFSIKPDGSDYRTLLGDLDFSVASLDVFEDKIYGVSRNHVFFTLNKDGTGYQELPLEAHFVIAEGDKLFGLAGGGTENKGTLFRSNLDGSDYQIIHEFGVGPNNGFTPNPDLVVIGSTLYGSTRDGGEFWKEWRAGGGTVYSLPTDASEVNAVPEPISIVIWLGLAVLSCVICRLKRT